MRNVGWVFTLAWVASALLGGFGTVLAADCDSSGMEDLAEIEAGLLVDCNQNEIPDLCEVAAIGLGVLREDLPLASAVRGFRIEDFDLDGRLDLFVLNRDSRLPSRLTLFLSLGDRSFEEFSQETVEGLRSFAVADFNLDGLPDVVATDLVSLFVFLNVDGIGFASPSSYPLTEGTEFLVTGDLNGDGRPDIFTTNERQDTASVLLAEESDEGSVSFSIGPELSVGDFPEQAALGDFDSDGDLDAVTVNRDTVDLTFLVNDGAGTLEVGTVLPLDLRRPRGIRSADLNGDGAVDLLVGSIGVLLSFLGDGAGTFHDGGRRSISGTLLETGDFDRDGDLDAVFPLTSQSLALAYNNGEGHLGVSRTISSGRTPAYLAAGDLDGDGELELVRGEAGGNAATVLWSSETAGFALRRQDVLLRGCADSRGCRPHGGTSGDFDGDGVDDIVVSNTHPGSISIALSDGHGDFGDPPAVNIGGIHPQSATSGDLDGDGDRDLLTTDNIDNHLYVHLNHGDGSFERAKLVRVGTACIHVSLADFDDDGDLDAVTANEGANSVSVLFNDGAGSLSAGTPRDYRVRSGPKSVATADFDGDGRIDIVSGNSGAPTLSVLRNADGKTFEEATSYSTRGRPHFVTTGDFDEDGHIDVGTADQNTATVSVYLNRGDGTLAPAMENPLGPAPYSVTALDLDADGHLDLITGNEGASSVSILFGNGNGSFEAPFTVSSGTGLRFILPGDFDNDGDLDLATNNREGVSLTVLFQDSSREVPDFMSSVCTALEFSQLARRDASSGVSSRFVKFLLPASDDPSLLPLIFQNTNRFELHQDLLAEAFPERFPALSSADYVRLVGQRSSRQYFVGAIRHVAPPGGLELADGNVGQAFGFSVFADFSDPQEALSAEETGAIYTKLRQEFRLEPLVYLPTVRAAVVAAREWQDPGFPIFTGNVGPMVAFQAYTKAVGIGRVRILDRAAFEEANAQGQFSFQDLLVLEEAPRDIEGVAGGVITAEPQGELSHVAIRTSRRGTPNAFVDGAIDIFTPLEGRLVRLEVTTNGYTIEEVTPAAAAEFWSTRLPRLSEAPSVDPDYDGLPHLMEVAELDLTDAVPSEARFGGKVSHLARLQRVFAVDGFESYQLDGFAIPVRHYLEFMQGNTIPSLGNPAVQVSYEAYIAELTSDERFQSDSRFRFETLETLRDHMREEGLVSSDLVARLAARVREVFGTTTNRVRFRSSSNVEDALEFNGAGLYDSTSVCAEDDLDADQDGPSHCDPERSGERGVERALKKVWASLWNFRAYEERAFYGMDQKLAAMALLVNQAFVDEVANGVVFTGNPANPFDRRYIVSAQPGEQSVVSPDPGVQAEKDLLELSEDGVVRRIVRATSSTLVPEGARVLSDGQLEEMGRVLWHVDQNMPLELGGQERRDVLLDLEFKLTPSGALAFKQVRPFLLSDPGPPPPVLALEIPDGTVACGVFAVQRGLQAEYELKSQLRFRAGTFDLPTAIESFSADIVDAIRLGPAQELLEKRDEGRFEVRRVVGRRGEVTYSFDYRQEFGLASGETFLLQLAGLDFVLPQEATTADPKVLNESLFTGDLFVGGTFPDGDAVRDVTYSACEIESLPLFEILFELRDGGLVFLEEKFLEISTDTGPAYLRRAFVELGGQRRDVQDYWRLAYTAARHNERVSYRVVLERPLAIAGVEGPVYGLDLVASEPREAVEPSVTYLDEALRPVGTAEVRAFRRAVPGTDESAAFRRGDVDSDGVISVSDAIFLLRHLFARGRVPTCKAAADANDNRRLELTDVISLFGVLFNEGAVLPDPFTECGFEMHPARLDCRSFLSCP